MHLLFSTSSATLQALQPSPILGLSEDLHPVIKEIIKLKQKHNWLLFSTFNTPKLFFRAKNNLKLDIR